MLVPKDKILLRQDEDGVWIAKSDLLPGCHAYGETEAHAILEFQEAAKAHLEALLDFGKPMLKPKSLCELLHNVSFPLGGNPSSESHDGERR